MKIFSALKTYMEPKSKPSSTVPNKIASGDTLTGRVLKVKADGLALFDFNGTKAWSEVSFPIKEGAQIEVTVIENQPRLRLKWAGPTPMAPPQTGKATHFSDFPAENVVRKLQWELGKILGTEGWTFKKTTLPRKIATGIEQLSSHFQQLNLGKNISELSSRVRSYMEDSGIFFEKKIEREIQTLYRSHGEIPTRHLHQATEIRDIIKHDLKPCLLILKHFIDENERKPSKDDTDHLRHLKPLINQMLKNIGFEQRKSASLQQERNVNPRMVYTDPRKEISVTFSRTEKLLPTITELTPKLHHFLKTEGPDMDVKIQHSFIKVIDLFEIISSRESSGDPPIHETTLSHILKEDLPQHLKRLADFFRLQAASNSLDATTLEDIKKSLSHVRTEIDNWQAAGDGTKKAQGPETGQVISFTLPLPEETGKGRLKVFYSKKTKRGADEGFKMSLLLEMQNTGSVRTDFFLLNRQLKITFYLCDHKIEEVILAHADSIKDALAEHFSNVLLNVVVSEEKLKDFDIEHLSSESTSLIDLRV